MKNLNNLFETQKIKHNFEKCVPPGKGIIQTKHTQNNSMM